MFDRNNYGIWAVKMSVALKAQGLWDAVNQGGVEFAKGIANYRKDRLVLLAIYSVLPNDVIHQIFEKKSTSKESWGAIKALYEGDARVREVIKNYEPMMESDDIVLMNDKVEPKLYSDGGVPVESKNWYLGNGASNHMTGQREFFEELDESACSHVVFNQGYVMEIKGRGTIRLQCKNGEHRVWSKVYFVPNLHANIISLGQFQEEGMKVMSYDDRVKIYEERGNLLTVMKRSKNQLYEIQLEVVCASVEDTNAHVGQQKAVARDEMVVVEPEVTPVGSSSVATPCTVTKVSEEVDVSMPDSEELNSEAHPECTRTTDVASCIILDNEVVSLQSDCHDEKAVEQQALDPVALTTATSIAVEVRPCKPGVGVTANLHTAARVPVKGTLSLCGSEFDPSEVTFRGPPSIIGWQEGATTGGHGSAMHVAPASHVMQGEVTFVSHNRKLALLASQRDLATTYEFCYSQVYRPMADRLRELSTRMYFVEPQFNKCGAATSFLTLCPKTAESTGRPPTHVCLWRLLDLYRENVLPDNNPMKTKHTCECSLSTEKPVKFEEADKKDGWRRAMDKLMAGMSVTWVLQGTTTTISRMMPARSSWRIWDPGRS
jgi:hypothetical protein